MNLENNEEKLFYLCLNGKKNRYDTLQTVYREIEFKYSNNNINKETLHDIIYNTEFQERFEILKKIKQSLPIISIFDKHDFEIIINNNNISITHKNHYEGFPKNIYQNSIDMKILQNTYIKYVTGGAIISKKENTIYKIIKEKEFSNFIINEINILSKLSHPNIIKLENIISYDNYLIGFSMKYNGINLKHNYNISSSWIFDIIEALKYLQNMKIVHGDMKPENIVINNNGLAKLIDFNSACIPMVGDICTTISYSPPEYIEEKIVSHKMDIYGLGIIVWEYLTGGNSINFNNEYNHDFIKLCTQDYNNRPEACDINPYIFTFIKKGII